MSNSTYTNIQKHTNLGTHTHKQNSPFKQKINHINQPFLKTFHSDKSFKHETQGHRH